MTRLVAAVALAAAALIVALVAVWFLGQALFVALAASGLAPWVAAAVTAAVGLVLAALMMLIARWLLRPRRAPARSAIAPPPAESSAVNGLAADIGVLAARELVRSAQTHPYRTVGAALVAGVAVGAMPELRKALLGWLK